MSNGLPCLYVLLAVLTSPFFTSSPVRAELTITVSTASKGEVSTTVINPTASAESDKQLAQQRQLYKKVRLDLQRGATASFTLQRDKLKGYPLYPYLEYTRISRNISLSNQQAIDDFLRDYGDVPVARTLRKRWLQVLYKRQRWPLFLSYYQPTSAATAQQCQYHYARYQSGMKELLANPNPKPVILSLNY